MTSQNYYSEPISVPPQAPPPQTPLNVGRGGAVILYIVLFLAIGVSFAVEDPPWLFALSGLQYMPFVLLAALAYFGLRTVFGKILSSSWLLLIFGAMLLANVTLSMTAVGAVDPTNPTNPFGGLTADTRQTLGYIILGSVVAALIGLSGFLPQVRRIFARFLPLDPDKYTHTIALVATVGITLMGIVPVIFLGEPPLLSEAAMANSDAGAMSDQEGLLTLVYTLVWSIPAAILAVGYGIRRNVGGALQRLGFVMPSLKQVAIGIGMAVVMVILMSVLDNLIVAIWESLGLPQTDGEAFEELLAFAINPLGAVLIGISAGVGEELAVRGVLQPRLGILLSNFFFTALHAYQYNGDALLSVFIAGLILGILRKYTNTTTSAITHGVYDFILVMMAFYAVELF